MEPNFLFLSKDNLTLQLKNLGINNWNELTKYIQNLPYGRNANRKDLSLILTEQKGTCSSKHAFSRCRCFSVATPTTKTPTSLCKR
jgi:hypothetical protein